MVIFHSYVSLPEGTTWDMGEIIEKEMETTIRYFHIHPYPRFLYIFPFRI